MRWGRPMVVRAGDEAGQDAAGERCAKGEKARWCVGGVGGGVRRASSSSAAEVSEGEEERVGLRFSPLRAPV